MTGGGFARFERVGAASRLVEPAPATGRTAWWCRPSDRSLVLGSGQGDEVVDAEACARAGCSLARRRSGGGVVLVAPAAQVWLDVFVPANDELAERDVVRGAYWLGELWAEVLVETLGLAEVEVHRGRAETTPAARAVCFAGLGPGEVTVGGRKVVGLSQRRNRVGTWLFTMVPLAFDAAELLALLSVDETTRSALTSELASVLALDVEAGRLEEALSARLS